MVLCTIIIINLTRCNLFVQVLWKEIYLNDAHDEKNDEEQTV